MKQYLFAGGILLLSLSAPVRAEDGIFGAAYPETESMGAEVKTWAPIGAEGLAAGAAVSPLGQGKRAFENLEEAARKAATEKYGNAHPTDALLLERRKAALLEDEFFENLKKFGTDKEKAAIFNSPRDWHHDAEHAKMNRWWYRFREIDSEIQKDADSILADLKAGRPVPNSVAKAARDAKLMKGALLGKIGIGVMLFTDTGRRLNNALSNGDKGYTPAMEDNLAAVKHLSAPNLSDSNGHASSLTAE